MNTQEQAIKIDYNDSMLGRGKPAQYKDGFYKGVITGVTAAPAKGSKNLQLTLMLEAVDEAGTPCGTEIKHFVGLPIPNPNEPGHKPYKDNDGRGNMYKRARELIRTMLGDAFLPQFPKRRDDNKAQSYNPVTGEDITPTEAREMSDEVDRKTLTQLLVWWNDAGTSLVGKDVFFATKLKDDGWAAVRYIRGDAGDNTVSYSDFTE